MGNQTILISVIVCTYNRVELLPFCLESLTCQTFDSNLYEVIIVNNNSTDETHSVAEQFVKTHSNFRVVKELEQGLSHSRNRGWQEARGEYVAYLDDDAKALPDWCERIFNAFDTVKPTPVAVGGEIHPWYEKHPPGWFTDDIEIRTWGHETGFLQPPRAPLGFSGSNMTFRKEILESYRGFSPHYGMKGNKLRFGEEPELFSRVYKDYPLFWYDPRIRVLHWVPCKNMTIYYRLKRAYYVAVSIADAGGKEVTFFLRSFLRFVFKSFELPFQVRWHRKNWQKDFLKYAIPVAKTLGELTAVLFRRADGLKKK